jgi:hypothetical protein
VAHPHPPTDLVHLCLDLCDLPVPDGELQAAALAVVLLVLCQLSALLLELSKLLVQLADLQAGRGTGLQQQPAVVEQGRLGCRGHAVMGLGVQEAHQRKHTALATTSNHTTMTAQK